MKPSAVAEITMRKIFNLWWPLAASWILMAFEGPLVSAIIARLPQPEINLAAFGSVAEPLRSLTSSPMIMLLAASTTLCCDWFSYLKLRRFMLSAGAVLTLIHFLLAFTPLYFLVARKLLGVPEEIIPLARQGLMIMLPLPWSIGYRRFQQGVMIRNGYSNAVVVGTFVRLFSVSLVLGIGYLWGDFPGVTIGAAALTAGMFAEAVYTGFRIRPIAFSLSRVKHTQNDLSWKSFAIFYLPLVLTTFLTNIWRPIGSAAISRMPDALESLAVWPVVSGLVFLFQTFGISYNEVVVTMLDRPGSARAVRNFALTLTLTMLVIFTLMTATPLSSFWFSKIAALPPSLNQFARPSLWIVLLIPALAVLMSWFQGAILFSRKTRAIPEAVVVFMLTLLVVLGIGVLTAKIPGVYVGAAGFSIAVMFQAFWLWLRSHAVIKEVHHRDETYQSVEIPTLEQLQANLD